METSNAILVELKNFLFKEDEDLSPSLKVYQKIDQEAKELLLESQKYMHLIGFYNIELIALDALESRLKAEGLKFDRLISTEKELYNKTKIDVIPLLYKRYNLSCYVDETEDSPWHSFQKIHRLKL